MKRPIVAFANVWKETGWNAIIYLAAITAIDPSLYEVNVGNVLNAGFEIQYLLGNGLVKSVSETIDIYVLKWGISQGASAESMKNAAGAVAPTSVRAAAAIITMLPIICIHPFLIVHGDRGATVPFNQSVLMVKKLRECGKEAEFYKVCGADHGIYFWTDELLDIVGHL